MSTMSRLPARPFCLDSIKSHLNVYACYTHTCIFIHTYVNTYMSTMSRFPARPICLDSIKSLT